MPDRKGTPQKGEASKKITLTIKKENAMDPKEKQVLEAMKKQGKPVRPGDIAKITQLDGKEVSTIIKNLKKQGKVVSPKRCFYEPV
jgi:DNA-binding MarR family transcriptional regulator